MVQPCGEDDQNDEKQSGDVGSGAFRERRHGYRLIVSGSASASKGRRDTTAINCVSSDKKWCAVQGSNLRPLPCEGSALPLS